MKFELETEHYLWDNHLGPGTIIGDDTPYPLPNGFAPSASMKPLDKGAEDLVVRTAKNKINWGRPDLNIPIAPSNGSPRVAAYPGNAQNAQPTIPPPMEHLTHPTDMRPGEPARVSPVIEQALREENERLAAKRDEDMAKKANEDIAKKTPKPPSTFTPPGMTPKPPAPPSNQVPRNTGDVVPQGDGNFHKPDEKKSDDKK